MRIHRHMLVTAIMLSVEVGVASAVPPVSFGPQANYATGSRPDGLAVGDLNLDGKLDMVTANYSAGTVSVLPGNGDGTFGARTDFATHSSSWAVYIGDLNLDGKPDLVNSGRYSTTVSVLLGNGNGTFGARTDFGVGAEPHFAAIGDVNGDTRPDLAVTNIGAGSVSVLLGNGAGGFGPKTDFSTGTGVTRVALADLNGDGKLDLAVTSQSANMVSVLLGDGAGGFGPGTAYATGASPHPVSIGDLDGDGYPDLVTGNYSAGTVSVFRGNGDGTFRAKSDYGVGAGAYSVAIGDLNGDGIFDLATSNESSSSVSVLLGNGDGTFGARSDLGTGAGKQTIGFGDFSRDGRPDLATTCFGADRVEVWLNTTTGSTVSPQPPGVCISTIHPCVEVPITIARGEVTPMRGYSVNLELSANLTVCSPGIEESNYLGSIGATDFHVVEKGGGSYTVDCAILGLPCGATASTGTLFALHLGSGAPVGVGTVTVTSVTLRDCGNAPIAGFAGPPASITIDNTPPAAPTALTAAQVRSGNDANGTTQITLTFTPPGDAALVQVYRAGYGNSPEYDDPPGAGSAPVTPVSYPPGAPWVLTGVTASGQADEVATRDVWYYVAYVKDACGNVSLVSNRTNGTLNYHLGDVANGAADCVGDNLVNTADVSLLGAHYGTTLGSSDAYGCLDVGPTLDFSVQTRPTTDNKVGFEDLMMFAINYGQVSKPGRSVPTPEAAGHDALALAVPEISGTGTEFAATVEMTGAGVIQGLSLELDYDAAVVTPIDVSPGELLTRQAAPAVVLSSGPGNLDVALLGGGAGISGRGELARIIFRVVEAGNPALELIRADARDSDNRRVPVVVNMSPDPAPRAPLPTNLGHIYPNPFVASASIPFGLRAPGPITLSVFDVSGRLVRTLLSGEATAGEKTALWDGRDDAGRQVSSGLYVIRMRADGAALTRPVYFVR